MKRLKNWFVFGLATVAFLAPLKFGTPVIIQASAVMPRDSFEWLHFSWPNELVILFIFADFIWLVLDRDRIEERNLPRGFAVHTPAVFPADAGAGGAGHHLSANDN